MCLLVPNHIPTPNTADRVRNQALMRIFRVSLGPAPRPPWLLPLGTCAGGRVMHVMTGGAPLP